MSGTLTLLAACGGGTSAPPAADPPAVASAPAPAQSLDPARDPALARFYTQRLRWRGCGEEFSCTSLTVPVSWSAPAGATMKLAVNRTKARDRATRIGSLLINPGGPGASGVEYAVAVVDRFGPEVRARYDVVGFDPRGVGSSAPIDCLSDGALDRALAVDPTPDDAADLAEVDRAARALANGCAQRNGELLGNLDTASVARDVDVLRAVLGDEQLNWLGYSYGTYLGATYAGLFPTRVGRMVLDGAVDPALDGAAILRGQSEGFEIAFSAFVADCLADRTCDLGRTRKQLVDRLSAFLAELDEDPIPTRDTRDLNEALATTGILAGMYAQFRWPQLRAALSFAYRGDGTGLLSLADAYTNRLVGGGYADNSAEVIYAVNCLDHPGPSSIPQIQATLPDLVKISPLFGQFIGWGALPCHYWPVEPRSTPAPIRAPGAAPILVVGTTNDPATPYAWARSLAEQLESGVLLTREGDGHTAYGQGNRCIDKAVERYLVSGTPPQDGTRC